MPQASAAWQQGIVCNYRLPAGFEIGPWNTVSTQELAALAPDEDADYPEELAPLEEPALIEPLTSLVLRHRDRIIGWIMTHRLDATTLQYTRLHVEPPYQRLGRGDPKTDRRRDPVRRVPGARGQCTDATIDHTTVAALSGHMDGLTAKRETTRTNGRTRGWTGARASPPD